MVVLNFDFYPLFVQGAERVGSEIRENANDRVVAAVDKQPKRSALFMQIKNPFKMILWRCLLVLMDKRVE